MTADQIEKSIRDRIAEIDAQTASILKERVRLQTMLAPHDVNPFVVPPGVPPVIWPPTAPWARPQPYYPWTPEVTWEYLGGGTNVTISGTGVVYPHLTVEGCGTTAHIGLTHNGGQVYGPGPSLSNPAQRYTLS